jgi:translocation and assembly module TamA
MRLPSLALPAAALCLFASGAVHAAKVERVAVIGLDEAMTDNVRSAVTLVDVLGKDLSGRRLAYLVREAEQETREALEPFGYYSPTISVERDRDSNAGSTVTITVDPGEPVRVRREHVAIEGVGGRDRYLREDLAGFRPRSGEVFEHPLYEASKTRISRRLAQRGYFDADCASRRVEVTRA